MTSEAFKLRTIPSIFDTGIANIKSPAQLLIIEATRQSLHIACDIHAPPTALASINAIVVDIVSQIQNGWNRAGIKSDFEAEFLRIYGIKELLYERVVHLQNIRFTSKSNGFVKKKNHCVNTGRETIVFQPHNCFFNRIVSKNIMNVRFYASIQKHLNRTICMLLAIPGDCYCTTVSFTQIYNLICKTKSRRSEIRHNIVLPTILQNLSKIFVLVNIATATKRKLKCFPLTFVNNAFEIFKRHIWLFSF